MFKKQNDANVEVDSDTTITLIIQWQSQITSHHPAIQVLLVNDSSV
jgi:hypothetical protein